VAVKKHEIVRDQIGLDEVTAEFHVPVVVPARKSKPSTLASALDLTRRPQTWLKLLSLNVYLPVWFGKISNRADNAYYLDFFAGPGAYVNGVLTAKGSPVVACEAAAAMADRHATRGRTWTPHLRFVEPDAKARATLGSELARFDGEVDYRILPMTAADAIGALVAESAGKPTLAFFDPFGYDIDLRWVEAFARDGINEVLFTFDAQALKRNVAAGQVAGVTEFSGGDWWREHVEGPELDLESYLRALATRLRGTFRYAGVQQFEFLSNHALRAVAQCCGSIVGRREWLAAVRKSRHSMTLVDDIFPELDQQALVDGIIERLGAAAGQTEIYKQVIGRLDDLDWTPDAVDQAFAFLTERRYVTWSDRKASAGHMYRLFQFTARWPTNVVWDGVTRAALPRPGRPAVPTGR
jgi:three-Cys-motif partner protein